MIENCEIDFFIERKELIPEIEFFFLKGKNLARLNGNKSNKKNIFKKRE